MALRLVQLYVGLVLFGVTVALIILSGLGNAPWDVLHEGLFIQTGLGTGWWAIIVGALVMVAWIPLRERPGLGTVSNVLVVGTVMEFVLTTFDQPGGLAPRLALLIGGVAGNGIACGMYIGARFGPGPRDGLMTGLARRGLPVGVARTGIEMTVLVVGVLLGGTVGVGTLVYALGIGAIVHRTLPYFDQERSTITVVDLTTAVAASPGLRSSSSAASRDISETIR